MRFLNIVIVIFICFAPALVRAMPLPCLTIKVKDFGATGDGIADDRPAVQAAMDYVKKAGCGSVLFEHGTYLLTSSTTKSAQLMLSDWQHPYSINFIGNNATLVTTVAGTKMIQIDGYWHDSVVQGLIFANKHGVTTERSEGIWFSGGKQNAIKAIRFTHNTFKNFSRHLAFVGINGMEIDNNTFIMEKGRDSGTSTNTEPNVGIWAFSHENGASLNVVITNNTYDGCSDVADLSLTVSKHCGDGLIFGMPSHMTVRGNHIRHFSYEGIFLWPDPTKGEPSQIIENQVDGTPVPGDTRGGGWGIRCDADDCLTQKNIVTNTVVGIMGYGPDYKTNIQRLKIIDNTVSIGHAGQQFEAGISIVGVSNPQISGNQITFNVAPTLNEPKETGSGIMLSGANPTRLNDNVSVTKNVVVGMLTPRQGNMKSISMQWLNKNYTIKYNNIQVNQPDESPSKGTVDGFDILNMSGTKTMLTDLMKENKLVGVNKPYIIANGIWE